MWAVYIHATSLRIVTFLGGGELGENIIEVRASCSTCETNEDKSSENTTGNVGRRLNGGEGRATRAKQKENDEH